MRRLTLSEWASLGELIGTVAVVISLLLVVVSIRQNTEALHGNTDNLIFERHSALSAQIITDHSLAAILAKKQQGREPLDAVELIRWTKYIESLLDIWAIAYTRRQENLLDERQWRAWDQYFKTTFSAGPEKLSHATWQHYEYGFDPRFWEHVRTSLFDAP